MLTSILMWSVLYLVLGFLYFCISCIFDRELRHKVQIMSDSEEIVFGYIVWWPLHFIFDAVHIICKLPVILVRKYYR